MSLVRLRRWRQLFWVDSSRAMFTGLRYSQTQAENSQGSSADTRLSPPPPPVSHVHSERPLTHYTPPARQCWVRSFQSGAKLGIVELSGSVFCCRPRLDLLHRVVVWQRAKIRAGTAKVKDRGEVRGGGKKPWSQKGSGRARHGSIRSPLWRGGGVVHGPRGPVSYDYTLPKKVRQLGLRTALSVKFDQGDLCIVDALQLESHKTQALDDLLRLHRWSSALLVDGGEVEQNLKRASANLPHIDILPSIGLNVYSILLRSKLVLSVGALRMLEERLSTFPTHGSAGNQSSQLLLSNWH